MRKISFFVLLFSLVISFSGLTMASYPALPTTLYGKVLDSTGKPVAGITVNALWYDSDGNEVTSTARSMSSSEAEAIGDMTLSGHYLFNHGDIKAKLGTEITISVDGYPTVRKVAADPGGSPINVEQLVLKKEGDTVNEGNLGMPPGTGKGTGKGGGIGDGSGTGSGEGDSKLPDNPNVQSTGMEGRNVQPPLPTTIFGQVLDDKGEPLSGADVTAEWVDEDGNEQSATATTLTKGEAKDLGDKNLEGYFMFNKGEIDAKPGTKISLQFEEETEADPKFAESVPGQKVQIEKTYVFHGQGQRPVLKSRSYSFGSIINGTKVFVISGTETAKEILPFIIVGFVIIGLVLLTVYSGRITKRMKVIAKNHDLHVLYQQIDHTLKIKSGNIMTDKVFTLSKDSKLKEALNLMISNEISTIIVVEDRLPVGIITEYDMLSQIRTNFSKETVGEVMSTVTKTATPEFSLMEMGRLFIENSMRKLPVVKDGKLVGIVTQTDLAKAYDAFSSKNIIDSASMPLVGSVMQKKVVSVEPKLGLMDAVYKMGVEGTDYVVAVEMEHPMGIVTIKDVMEEYQKNPSGFSSFKVEHVMSSPVRTIVPSVDIFNANRMMIKNNFRRLMVLSSDKLVGTISHADVIRGIHNFLGHTVSHKQEISDNGPSEDK